MNIIHSSPIRSILLPVTLCIAMFVMLSGCGQGEQTTGSDANQANADQAAGDEQLLGEVAEFDGFTLRANVSRTRFLPDAMARQYGIETEPDLVLLNLVILENRPDQQSGPVSADVSAQYESRIGQIDVIDMRAVEANGHVSYIGTLDASAERVFELVIEAQPEGTDQSLQMTFEVQLDSLESE